MNIAAMAMKQRQAVIEECDAGMIKMVVPIFYESEFVGAVGACGFVLDDGEVDSFLINKMTEIDEEKVEQLADGTPAITTAKAEELSKYISEQIEEIISAHTP